jgi:hypothetical protein
MAERWNKPMVLDKSEAEALIAAGLRELLELSISLLLLFQIYDRKIDSEIANAFLAIKKLQNSRFYILSLDPEI